MGILEHNAFNPDAARGAKAGDNRAILEGGGRIDIVVGRSLRGQGAKNEAVAKLGLGKYSELRRSAVSSNSN